MTDSPHARGVIPGRDVRRVAAPVLVECGQGVGDHTETMTVIPLMGDDRIEGFEVRCRCGSSVLVECVYEASE